MENQKGQKVKFLRSDNVGEYTSSEFKEYLASEYIEHQLTIPGRLEQNGVVKRIDQILTERAHSMRLLANMSESFWAEAVSHASYLVNMSPSTTINF